MTDSDTPLFRTKTVPTVPRLGTPVYHKDVNLDYGLDGQALILYNTEAVKKKIQNVLGVLLGEEPFEPTAGSLIQYRVFQGQTKATAYLLEGDTIAALKAQMAGEITVVIGQSSIVATDNDAYAVTVPFQEVRGGPIEYVKFDLDKRTFASR